jgi:uncharacterized protein
VFPVDSRLQVPARPPRPEDGELPEFDEPEHAPPLEVESLDGAPAGRFLRRELASGLLEQVFDWDLGGAQRFVTADLLSDDASHTVYSIVDGDPLSATVRFRASSGMARDGWRARSEVRAEMTADADAFHVTTRLEASEGDEPVFAREWAFSIPRDHV